MQLEFFNEIFSFISEQYLTVERQRLSENFKFWDDDSQSKKIFAKIENLPAKKNKWFDGIREKENVSYFHLMMMNSFRTIFRDVAKR